MKANKSWPLCVLCCDKKVNMGVLVTGWSVYFILIQTSFWSNYDYAFLNAQDAQSLFKKY
jgi:hypothetical protein